MNNRQKYELRTLIKEGKLDMDKMAEKFSVNLRTIRYDIAGLSDYIKVNFEGVEITVAHKMAYIDEETRRKFCRQDSDGKADYYRDYLRNEERILMITFDLCWSQECKTISLIADKYCVSRATINSDLQVIKTYCLKNKIKLQTNRGKGLYVEGTELERRKNLAKIIHDHAAISKHKQNYLLAFNQWFKKNEIEKVACIISQIEQEFSMCCLSDVAYEMLIVYVALAIERFRIGYTLNYMEDTFLFRKDGVQFRIATKIASSISDEFDLKFSESEIFYLGLQIGAKSSGVARSENTISLEYYCIRIIAMVSRRCDIDLTKDERLYESLLQHLNACFYRKRYGLYLENPIKDEIIESKKELYQIVDSVIQLEEFSKIIIKSEDEVAYLLVHLVAAIERRGKNQNNLVSVVIVCATGLGTAELLVANLEKNFCLNISGCIAAHQLEEFLKKNSVDLIVSTVELEINNRYLKVSPFLKHSDIVNIGKEILNQGLNISTPNEMNKEWSDTAKYLYYLFTLYPNKDQEIILKEKIKELDISNKAKEREKYMLSELLIEERIWLDVECETWKDAVVASGKPLLERGDIEESYVQAVIDSVIEVGPYIVITKGIALPHASNKTGVNKTAISYVRLENAVEFGNEENDPVKHLFMLATVDSNSHIGALQELAEMLEKNRFLNLIESAENASDIIAYIKANEK